MTFPRQADGSLDFKAFLALDRESKILAFEDLKQHGKPSEKKQFQQWKALLGKAVEVQKNREEAEKLVAKLGDEIEQHKKELEFSIRKLVSDLPLPAQSEESVQKITVKLMSASLKA